MMNRNEDAGAIDTNARARAYLKTKEIEKQMRMKCLIGTTSIAILTAILVFGLML